ncbi:SpvB/TcaC N-terminal domain-containing protein [Photobacterium sp. Hal280]|uniref:SpvB/TcaC N-terminal domain-containing protein n=1 Tax=Photobacterium sp. Hal280 TaxID=3035163 RepID=UPI00301C063B
MKYGRSHRLMVKFLTVHVCFLMVLSLGLAPAEALALTSGHGKSIVLSGEYQTAGGEATYSLPISVAPGRAGHQPQLSFEYRSNSGNGPLGVGWHLKGLSSVYRCGKNLAIDGAWGGVNLDASDQYCIDGQRLVAVNGKPGGDQTEYRTHMNDYRKIVSIGKQGSGPQYFKVWTKSGQVFEYGVSGDSRVELPGKSDVYKWSLNKLTDKTRRNAITYSYSEDNAAGTHRLSTVSYVGGSIALNYDSRADKTFSYLKGSKLNQSYRIKSVVTKNSSGSEFATYKLSYRYSEGTQRSLLDKVEQCVGSTCSTPVTFSWQMKSQPSYQSTKAIFPGDIVEHKFFDVERDGNVEILALSNNRKTVYTNTDAKKKSVDGDIFILTRKMRHAMTLLFLIGMATIYRHLDHFAHGQIRQQTERSLLAL